MIQGADDDILPAVMNKKLQDRFFRLLSKTQELREEASCLKAATQEYIALNNGRSQTLRRAFSSRHAAELVAQLDTLLARLG